MQNNQPKGKRARPRKGTVAKGPNRYPCWSRLGPPVLSSSHEGAALRIASNRSITDYFVGGDSAGATLSTMAFFNASSGSAVAHQYSYKYDQSGNMVMNSFTTPYLNDASITASRALKSTVTIQNVTAQMYRKPLLYVLRTSQRFKTVGSVPTITEMAAIRNAIIAHPDTQLIDSSKPHEFLNVPISSRAFEKYHADSANANRYLFDYDDTDIDRGMTVTWVVMPYRMYPHDQLQEYVFDIYTQRKCRHSMSSLLSTISQAEHGATPQKLRLQDGQTAIINVPQ